MFISLEKRRPKGDMAVCLKCLMGDCREEGKDLFSAAWELGATAGSKISVR